MRLLINPSGYNLMNHGDAAMTLVALARLRTSLPHAEFTVVNLDEQLPSHDPSLQLLDPFLRRAFFTGLLPSRLYSALSPSQSTRLRTSERILSSVFPSLWGVLSGFRRVLAGHASTTGSYIRSLLSSHALILSGGGHLNDAFLDHALTILDECSIAIRHNIPVYLLGQGIGPITDPRLLARARQVLPNVRRICLREVPTSLPLLESIGVPPARITVTGDDAIELVHPLRPRQLGDCIGLNLRLASYSQTHTAIATALQPAIQKAAKRLNASLIPVPISLRPNENDLRAARLLIPSDTSDTFPAETDFPSPAHVIRQTGRCRVVITGSYHAGVFSLAQGIPIIGLSRSTYYTSKFLGLSHIFGGGVTIVHPGDDASNAALCEGILRAWDDAPAIRQDLLLSADKQRAAGADALLSICQDLESQFTTA